jgi:hypothetical protein
VWDFAEQRLVARCQGHQSWVRARGHRHVLGASWDPCVVSGQGPLMRVGPAGRWGCRWRTSPLMRGGAMVTCTDSRPSARTLGSLCGTFPSMPSIGPAPYAPTDGQTERERERESVCACASVCVCVCVCVCLMVCGRAHSCQRERWAETDVALCRPAAWYRRRRHMPCPSSSPSWSAPARLHREGGAG